MKKLLIILLLSPVFFNLNGQETGGNFYWSGGFDTISTKIYLIDSLTGVGDLNYEVYNYTGSSDYLEGKTGGFLIRYNDTIPINCIFQNNNYADTLFAKWEYQTLNADLTESLPRRITNIGHWATPTPDASNFYEAPTKATTNFLEVGVGKTYTDIPTCLLASLANDTIYVYDGTYTHTTYLDFNKAGIKFINVGNAILGAHGASYAALLRNHNIEFNGFTILPQSNGECLWVNTNVLNCQIKNNYMLSTGEYTIRNSSGSQATVTNNVIINNNASSPSVYIINYINMRENLFEGTHLFTLRVFAELDSINLEYNTFNGNATVLESDYTIDTLNYSYNAINNQSQALILDLSASTNTIAKYNNADITQRFLFQTIGEGTAHLNNNTITANTTSAIIEVNSCDINIEDNTLHQQGGGYNILIGKSASLKEFNILNNTVICDTASIIVIGEEASPNDSNYLYGVISGNEVIGNAGSELAQHAVFIYNNDSIDITYNSITEAALPLVFKANDVDYSHVRAWGNVMDGRLTLKGCHNSIFYNNTIAVQSGDDICVYSVNNGAVNSTGNKVYNNILYSNAPDTITGFGIITLTAGETIDINYNQIYSSGGLKIGQIGGTGYNWAGWQGLGNDLNSFNSDPLFKSSTQLWATGSSDAIGGGKNLGTTYNQALDISTEWTDNIVFKTQILPWDIGAYSLEKKSIIQSNMKIIRAGNLIVTF